MRTVARDLKVDVSTVSYWVSRTRGRRLDRVDLSNRKPGRAWNRTNRKVERKIVSLRSKLSDGVLGEFGAEAIAEALRTRTDQCPSRATINRVLARHGKQDGARRIRRPAPPKGWYLPAVAAREAEIDCFDFIEDLKIAKGPMTDVLTAQSVHGALTDAWVVGGKSTKKTVFLLLKRWRRDGLPEYAQFDNDTVFQGAHQFPDTVGGVSRLCLQLGIIPVFAPPAEHGPQNVIESYNNLWQEKVWQRHHVGTIAQLQVHSDRYVAAHRARHAAKVDNTPARRPLPASFRFDLQAPLSGMMIYIRRTNERGEVRNVLGRVLAIDPAWRHRLVRCEVDFTGKEIRCFGLRRRAPAEQPHLITINYHRIDKAFKGTL